jgi:solute:Na+ symporter, SSS family
MPLLFGLLPAFKFCGPRAAISSIIAGLLTFIITKNVNINSLALEVGLPTIVSATVFVIAGMATKTLPDPVKELAAALKKPT